MWRTPATQIQMRQVRDPGLGDLRVALPAQEQVARDGAARIDAERHRSKLEGPCGSELVEKGHREQELLVGGGGAGAARWCRYQVSPSLPTITDIGCPATIPSSRDTHRGVAALGRRNACDQHERSNEDREGEGT